MCFEFWIEAVWGLGSRLADWDAWSGLFGQGGWVRAVWQGRLVGPVWRKGLVRLHRARIDGVGDVAKLEITGTRKLWGVVFGWGGCRLGPV